MRHKTASLVQPALQKKLQQTLAFVDDTQKAANASTSVFPACFGGKPTGCVHCEDALMMMQKIPQDSVFDVVVADPPYNIGKDFGNDSDSRTLPDYLQWCDKWIGECLRLAKESAPVYIYGYAEILAHVAVRHPIENQRWLAWHYTNKTVPVAKFW